MEAFLTALFDLIGTFAFAVSGIRLAAGKEIDWFGAYLIGLATAVGGGTVRDLLLGVTPFWMLDGSYFITAAVALLAILVLNSKMFRWASALFLFDAVGLGLFTIIGISKTLQAGFPVWVCIAMGAITGSIGGVIRDVLLNEVPLLLRKDIYALACVAGGLVYFACVHFNFATGLTHLLAAMVVILIRVMAVKFHIHLPVLKALKPTGEKTGGS